MGVMLRKLNFYSFISKRYCSVSSRNAHKCKLLVVGGGAGGCSVAWRFSRTLPDNNIVVLEPSEGGHREHLMQHKHFMVAVQLGDRSACHYYQPLFTLVAAGIEKIDHSKKYMGSVLPPKVTWIKDCAEEFDPCNNVVHTARGARIVYEFMVVAVGLKNDYDKILGLTKALEDPTSCVCTIYSPQHCCKTWRCISQLKGGHALFTFPKQASKCSGAAQKIMYLADDYYREHKIRDLISISYNTGRDCIFGVPRYADALTKVACKRNIIVNCDVQLTELTDKEAIFVDKGGETISFPYNLLHVTPPMSPPACLTKCSELVSGDGYLHVDQYTLQHKRFANIYGVGDCIHTPNSKTAAAVSQQSHVVEQNLTRTMEGQEPMARYDGYGACSILTSHKTGMLAEFAYEKKICETFPFDQSKERRFLCYMYKNIFPYLYWNKLIKGTWNGPARIRKIINPFGA